MNPTQEICGSPEGGHLSFRKHRKNILESELMGSGLIIKVSVEMGLQDPPELKKWVYERTIEETIESQIPCTCVVITDTRYYVENSPVQIIETFRKQK